MQSVQRLRVLAEVAAHRSFSAAADALRYTQPAVSKQIALLEREVGATLVVRGARPIRLTEAGEALLSHAQAIFERLAAAEAEIEAIASLDSGRLRLGTFSSAGATLVVQAIAAFRSRHPGVLITMIEAGPEALAHRVRAGEVDLVVAYDYPAIGQTLDDAMESHHLLDDPDDLVVHPDHPLAVKRRVAIADLRDEDWLLPTLGPEHPMQKLLTAACAAAGFEPRVVFQVNDCEMTQALVAAGMGIAILPRLSLHPVHPGVTIRPLDNAPTRRVLALRLEQAQTPSSNAFLELLKECAAAYPEMRQPARA
jgi:DNA-binding transcriptional LysR family regulator